MISDSAWETIKGVIPVKNSKVGRPAMCPRKALNAMFYVLKTGCQWHMLPKEMGAVSTVHGKFILWSKQGVFDQIHRSAGAFYTMKQGKLGIWFAIDSISAKAPLAQESVGRNPTDRGKHGTKRSVIADRNGAPLAITVAPANRHDSKIAVETLKAFEGMYDLNELKIIAADAAYDAQKLRAAFIEKNFILLASQNKRRKKIDKPYRPLHRWIIERTLSWLNQNRGLKTCWSKTTIAYQAFCSFAAAVQLFKMSGIFV